MGKPPNRLELLTVLSGVEFADCYSRRRIMQIEGLEIPVIALDDLIANKRAAGPPQDLADVSKLQGRSGG